MTDAKLHYQAHTPPDTGGAVVRSVVALAWPGGLAVAGVGPDSALVQAEWLEAEDGRALHHEIDPTALAKIQLLSGGAKPAALFVAGPQCMLVPEELYDEQEARLWWRHAVSADPADEPAAIRRMPYGMAALYARPHFLPERLRGVAAYPLAYAALCGAGRRHWARAVVLPGYVHITVEENNAVRHCTLHEATTAEDVAWHLHNALGDAAAAARITFLAIDARTGALALAAARYFPPDAADRSYSDPWEPAARLYQLLASCAS